MLECDEVAISVLCFVGEKELTVFCVTHFNVNIIFKITSKVQLKFSEGLTSVTCRVLYQTGLLKNMSVKKRKTGSLMK